MPLRLPTEPPLSSKKWLTGLLGSVSWKALIAYGIHVGLDSNVLLAMVAAAGALETAYVGFQSAHDKAIKVAAMQYPLVEAEPAPKPGA